MTRLFAVVRQHAGDFAQHGGLTDAGTAQQQDAFTGLDQVFDNLDGAEDGPCRRGR